MVYVIPIGVFVVVGTDIVSVIVLGASIIICIVSIVGDVGFIRIVGCDVPSEKSIAIIGGLWFYILKVCPRMLSKNLAIFPLNKNSPYITSILNITSIGAPLFLNSQIRWDIILLRSRLFIIGN